MRLLLLGLLFAFSVGVSAQGTYFAHCFSSVKGGNNWTTCNDVYQRYYVRWRENITTGKVTTWISFEDVRRNQVTVWIQIPGIDRLKDFLAALPDPVIIGSDSGNFRP